MWTVLTTILSLINMAADWFRRQTIRVQAQKELSDDVVEKQRERVARGRAAGELRDDSGPDPNDRANW